TGSYTNRDGVKVYTTDVVVEEQDFCESKNASQSDYQRPSPRMVDSDGFMSVPDSLEEELPFA
ncbi:MAG: single-stranded DNA-binding protein, partial [Lachnospiraceae bacterium]